MHKHTLHKSRLDAFKLWLTGEGYEHRPGRGDYQVLQVLTTLSGWQVVFTSEKDTDHYTVNKKLMPLVDEFIRSKRAANPKTPWNPSRTATARVLNPLPVPTIHDVCGAEVEIAHHNDIYGQIYSDWPWVYRCKGCQSRVGMHPFTNIPLGPLADQALRDARKVCKEPFEQLWKGGRMSRTEAYAQLAQHLNLPVEQCHFGWFNQDQCQAARAWAEATLGGQASPAVEHTLETTSAPPWE